MSRDIFKDLFIFEMANNHQGSLEHGLNIIKKMGKIAKKHNIKAAVKLQYRHYDTFIHDDYKDRTDVKHIPRLMGTRLSQEDFTKMAETVRAEGMITMSTPFDEESVGLCMDQNLDIIKIASCSNMDWPLLEAVADTKKPIIISTGGLEIHGIDKIYNFLTHRDCNFAILHCIGVYPAPPELLQLDYIDKLKKRYPGVVIGYSGHESPKDTVVPTVAVAKGASILERHVGLPTETIKLNAYSMNPEQADKWIEAGVLARTMCRYENDKKISESERESLLSLKRGIFAKKNITKGDVVKREDVFFAMPCTTGQMTSGEFFEDMTASRDYKVNEGIFEEKPVKDVSLVRSVVHEAKGMINEAGIELGDVFDVELSHHFGMKNFRDYGAVIISIVNREYCKKIIVVLPGQKHPIHAHKIKEETFQLLYGDLDIVLESESKTLEPGDIQTVLRGADHSFSSKGGAIFEEISTTHIRNDSYYIDERIRKLDPMERKTILTQW